MLHAVRVTSARAPPSRAAVERPFIDLLDGTLDRESVNRWAAQWVADGLDVDDPVVFWALTLLCGTDLTHGPGLPSLHSDEQIAEWLVESRSRSASS